MVLLNLIAEHHWRHRHREQAYGRSEERVGRPERVTWKHTSPNVKQISNGNLLCDPWNSNWAR